MAQDFKFFSHKNFSTMAQDLDFQPTGLGIYSNLIGFESDNDFEQLLEHGSLFDEKIVKLSSERITFGVGD